MRTSLFRAVFSRNFEECVHTALIHSVPPPPPPLPLPTPPNPYATAVADKAFLGELYRAVNRSAFQRDARKARMAGMAQERAAKHEREAMHELGIDEFAVAMRTLSTHLRRFEFRV